MTLFTPSPSPQVPRSSPCRSTGGPLLHARAGLCRSSPNARRRGRRKDVRIAELEEALQQATEEYRKMEAEIMAIEER